jgi:hypothetical protein
MSQSLTKSTSESLYIHLTIKLIEITNATIKIVQPSSVNHRKLLIFIFKAGPTSFEIDGIWLENMNF